MKLAIITSSPAATSCAPASSKNSVIADTPSNVCTPSACRAGLAAGVPLLIFGVGHWTGGWANIVIALVLGGILALFFIWRRDLVANMVGHWFVDFIGNVLPRLLPS
jgi:hypothetical protein